MLQMPLYYSIGFNVETLHFKGINFTTWDVGGRDKIVRNNRGYNNLSICITIATFMEALLSEYRHFDICGG